MRRSLVPFATTFVLATALFAQTTAPARIRVGDEMEVYVFGEKELTGPVTVQTDGAIYVPRVGRIVVAGLTATEAQNRLLVRLRKIFVNPTATLSLSKQRSNAVFAVGGKESVIPYTEDTDLRQVLAAAQVQGDLDLLQVSVIRNGKSLGTFPVTDVAGGKQGSSISLRPNDVVVFERKPFIRVWVVGTVLKPGRVQLNEGDDVYRAIAEAGDLAVEPTGGPTRLRSDYVVTIRRGPQTITVPLVYEAGHQPVKLENGDTVSVQPPTQVRVTFTGYAKNPGEKIYKAGTSLATAVGAEGGAAPGTPPTASAPAEPEGSLRGVILFHNGVASFHDLSPRPSGPIGEQGPPVEDGDVVFIPRNERKIYVFGAVNRVGRIPFEDNRVYRLSDAVAEAGGLIPSNGAASGGTLTRVSVGRPGVDGKLEVKTYRLDKFVKSGDATQNPVLRPDDVVYVDTSRGLTLQSLTTAISAALLLYSASRI